jgi:dihydroorotase
MKSTLITDAVVVNEGKQIHRNILIRDERIAKILPPGEPLSDSTPDRIINAAGCLLMPGVIDDQVHFREPGLIHKADIHTESKAAVAGGITSFMEMPNTNPQTTTIELLEDKYRRAAESSLANYSFYIGATNENLEVLLNTNPSNVCGIKIFMGSSTGNMLVDDPETLREIFASSNLPIAVHCEDELTIRQNTEAAWNKYGEDVPVYLHPVIRCGEACYKSSRLAVELAEKHNARLHILHLSTAKELSLFDNGIPLQDKKITAEVCIHHLLFDDKDYHTRGNLIKWNPAIKSQHDRESLFQALQHDLIDVVATDHAPHTLAEKQNTYFKAPSGGPMVQHALVAMLEFYHKGLLSLEKIVEKMCHAPAIVFQIKERGFIREGYFADLIVVNPSRKWTVSRDNILYKCGWSPLEGMNFISAVTHTFVNGNLVYENGRFDEQVKGKRLLFNR